jgi:hypothetical protein
MATKKVSLIPPRQGGRCATDENVKARMEERNDKRLEMIRQFRAEHEKNEETEKSLQKMQILSFEPVEYEYLLEAEPWVEPPPASYEHIKTEAVRRVEVMYKDKLILYACGFIASFVFYLLFSLPLALGLFFAVGLFLIYQVSHMLDRKQNDLISALDEAQQEIIEKQKEEMIAVEEARKQHEFSQQLSKEEHRAIMEGKPETVGQLIKVKLEELALPAKFNATAEINGSLVNISVVLPDLSAIPKRRTRMLPTGYIEYEDKHEREINRQYTDLAVSLLSHIGIRIIEIAPTISGVYLRGFNDNEDLLLYIEITRNRLSKPGRLVLSEVLQDPATKFSSDIDYKLLPIENPGISKEWDASQPTYKIGIKSLKQG